MLAEELTGEYGAAGCGNRKYHDPHEGNGEEQESRHCEAEDPKPPHPHRRAPIGKSKHPPALEGCADQFDPQHPASEGCRKHRHNGLSDDGEEAGREQQQRSDYGDRDEHQGLSQRPEHAARYVLLKLRHVTELALQLPDLDDVFFKLTGHVTGNPDNEKAEALA